MISIKDMLSVYIFSVRGNKDSIQEVSENKDIF